ncbi:testis-expressed protein 264-like [Tubulanus polymorphus]|uniref:testis-expressed protein 264-like n=1 Tax=Tubulanus polymorphus TaxID=672921 RepID=UPI003DA5989B
MVDTLLIIGIFALVFLILLTLIAAVLYSGLLENVQIGAGKPFVKNLVVAYKFEQGPYKNVGDLFTRTVALAPDNRSFGVYYDDPREVQAEHCRYIVGSILAEGQEQETDENVRQTLVKNGYHLYSFPAVTNCVKTTFPYRTSLSCLIAVYRVYPLLANYIKENRLCAHPMMEIYDGFEIQFMAPLAKQDEFYVPEVRDEDEEDDESVVTESSFIETASASVSAPTEVGKLKPPTKLLAQNPEAVTDVKELSPDQDSSKPPTPTDDSKSSDNGASSASSFEDLNMDQDDMKKWSELNEEVTQPEN